MLRQVFSRDEAGLPRTWGASANIPAVNAAARLAAAQLLAQLALLRLGPAAEVGAGCAARYWTVLSAAGSLLARASAFPSAPSCMCPLPEA